MTEHLYIMTGASRGLGLAIAEQLLNAKHTLLCFSRHSSQELADRARALGCALDQSPADLQHGVAAAAKLVQWLRGRKAGLFASATLINNAGVLAPILPLSASDPGDLAYALRVGLEAPLLLTAAFLQTTEDWGVPRRVLNISSGLGRRAMASQAAYCAAKAGMDHFTRCLALDEALKPHGAQVCSLAPGVIDTDMQIQLRETEASMFPDQIHFANLKANGQLTAPADAARQILRYLARADFGSNPVGDLRE
jgi:NAD(P)-dependent dehydrogenase (short-subunit alcohol dehydrogenase family)